MRRQGEHCCPGTKKRPVCWSHLAKEIRTAHAEEAFTRSKVAAIQPLDRILPKKQSSAGRISLRAEGVPTRQRANNEEQSQLYVSHVFARRPQIDPKRKADWQCAADLTVASSPPHIHPHIPHHPHWPGCVLCQYTSQNGSSSVPHNGTSCKAYVSRLVA